MRNQEELALLEREPLEQVHPPSNSPSDLPTPLSDRYLSLRDGWHILLKRRWTVLTAAFVMTVIVAVACFKMKPVYRATARAEVEAPSPPIQTLNDLYQSVPSDDIFLQTQVNVSGSDSLAWQTIEQLQLGKTAEFTPSRNDGVADSAVALQNWMIEKFRKHLSVELVRRSRILEVGFESTDPAVAARVANALVNNYIEYNFRKKYDATRQVSGWMAQQLDELKAKVERSQQAVVDYERGNAIVNISEKQNVVEQRLADLSKDLTVAQNDRMEKESFFELVKTNEPQVAFVAQNELLQRLEEKHAELKAQYVDALGQYGPNFPRVVRLSDQVSEIQSLVDRERNRAVERIRHDYAAAMERERLVSAAVAREKVEVGKLNQLLIQHNILRREFETNQQLYDNLLQRLKDATLSAGLRATNIHVIDRALQPTIPIWPRKLLSIVVALLVGSILGVTLAFCQEALDDSIKDAQEVESLIASPCLAIIPAANGTGSYPHLLGPKQGGVRENGHLGFVVLKEPTSVVAESYRALRTSILLSTASHAPQVLLVTSSQPNEGKTSISLNLSLSLAQRGGRVLIIDGDLRRPAIAKQFGMVNEKGLSSILAGVHKLDEALQSTERAPSLWVLPAGPYPPNPAELLSSSRMRELLSELRERFDYLVVDTPPSLILTDATILSTLVDGVILVVESGVTSRAALTRTYRILTSAGGRVLGVVLNKVNLRYDWYYHGAYDSNNHYIRSLSTSTNAETPESTLANSSC